MTTPQSPVPRGHCGHKTGAHGDNDMLSRLQRDGAMRVRARSLRTGRPIGRAFTIRWHFATTSYLIEQDGVTQEGPFYLDRHMARDWMLRLKEIVR